MPVTPLGDFAVLLELGLSRVFKESLPTHKTTYGAWLMSKQAKEWTEDEDLVTGFGAMPEKKCFARIDHHIEAEVGAGSHQGAQFFGAIGMGAWFANQEHFPCPEPTHVQRTDRAGP